MTYRMEGLAPAAFESLFGLTDAELAAHNAVRVIADGPGYPCRISLAEAQPGEELILINHVSNDVEGPFRTAHAIYIRKGATASASEDAVPPYLDTRTIGLRGIGSDGMLKGGLLALPGEADACIRELFGNSEVQTIHAHTATYGCFLARIERN